MCKREKLIRQWAADWARREIKWHKRLETERRWSWLTAAIPILIAALIGMGTVWGVSLKITSSGGLLTAIVGWRAQMANHRLTVAKYGDVWASAERIAELYKALIAELEDGEPIKAVFQRAKKIESTARSGVHPELAAALAAE